MGGETDRNPARIVGVLAFAVLLMGCAPSALGAEAGQIDGVVTEAVSPHNPIAGIDACVRPKGLNESVLDETGPEEACATTNASGEYTMPGLPGGEYIVEFVASTESGLNYVRQYYDDKASESTADLVSVSSTGVVTGIDAQLVLGGQIAGIVTDASTGSGVDGVIVCAVSSALKIGGCATSGSDGVYTISGLESGEYQVGFGGTTKYVFQYYENKTESTEANYVTVRQGSLTPGINAALQPRPASGSSIKLASPNGSGPAIPRRGAGKGERPRLTILSRKLVAKGRSIDVRVACAHGSCKGSIDLAERINGGKSHLAITLAQGSFSLAPGQQQTVALRVLSRKARHVFADTRNHTVRVSLTMVVKGGNSLSETVLVR